MVALQSMRKTYQHLECSTICDLRGQEEDWRIISRWCFGLVLIFSHTCIGLLHIRCFGLWKSFISFHIVALLDFFFKDLIISQSTFEEGIATIPKGQLKESIFFFHVHLSPFHLPTVTYLVREESKKAQWIY